MPHQTEWLTRLQIQLHTWVQNMAHFQDHTYHAVTWSLLPCQAWLSFDGHSPAFTINQIPQSHDQTWHIHGQFDKTMHMNVGFKLTMIHLTLAPCHHLVAAYKNQLACSQIGARQWCTIILHHTNPALNLSWNMLTNCRAYQFTNKVTKPRTTSRKYQHCQDIITTWLWTCQHAYHVPNLAVDL